MGLGRLGRLGGYGLGHFQAGIVTEALYTLNSPPVVSFKYGVEALGLTGPKDLIFEHQTFHDVRLFHALGYQGFPKP